MNGRAECICGPLPHECKPDCPSDLCRDIVRVRAGAAKEDQP